MRVDLIRVSTIKVGGVDTASVSTLAQLALCSFPSLFRRYRA